MDALVMCGGRGTRLSEVAGEKPLVPVCGEPMVDRVVSALATSGVGRIHAAVSPNAPETRERLAADPQVVTVETPGEGYVSDLGVALETVGRPALTVAADLPLLEGDVVDDLLSRHGGGSATVAVPVALKRRLGVSVGTTMGDGLVPTGLNVVAGPAEETIISDDPRVAINVNRPTDLRVAEDRCG